jgi:hypothetical protein
VGAKDCQNAQDVEKVLTFLIWLQDIHQMAQKLLFVKIVRPCILKKKEDNN